MSFSGLQGHNVFLLREQKNK